MTAAMPAPLDVKLMNMTASVLFGLRPACAGGGCLVVMRYPPGFAIARIVVQGDLVHNNAVTLRANVGPLAGGQLFTVDLRAAREAFEQVPWVRKAAVRREYPGLHVDWKSTTLWRIGARVGLGAGQQPGRSI